MYKLIATDLDRTLLNARAHITPYTAGVLNACRDKGFLLAYITARPERATRFVQAAAPAHLVIANNGATIVQEGRVLQNLCIPQETLTRLFADILSNPGIASITAEAGDCLYTTYDGPPWEDGWNPVHADFQSFTPRQISKLSIQCEDRIAQQLMRSYPRLRLFTSSGEQWHQITVWEATKANALAYAAASLNISLDEIIAFGDDHNDVAMLAACGMGVAVENAQEEAKRAAKAVCGANTEDGVARWLVERVLNAP